MAGETPGADAIRKRRRLLLDKNSTDKTYASGDVSALGEQTVADTTMKPGQQPAPAKPTALRADDKSADKYYANGGSNRVRGQQAARAENAARQLGPPAKLGATPPKARKAATAADAVTVRDKSEINGVLGEITARLKNGATGVVIYIKTGDSTLLRRTRAGLEMLMTREVITEEEYHEVRFSYELDAAARAEVAAKLGAPTPARTVRTEQNEAVAADPMSFLDSDEDDPVVDTTAVAATEVDTSGDVASSPAPGYGYPSVPAASEVPPSDDDDDGADTDVPAPQPEPVRGGAADAVLIDERQDVSKPAADSPPAGTTPAGPESKAPEAAEDLSRRRGRRSGRG